MKASRPSLALAWQSVQVRLADSSGVFPAGRGSRLGRVLPPAFSGAFPLPLHSGRGSSEGCRQIQTTPFAADACDAGLERQGERWQGASGARRRSQGRERARERALGRLRLLLTSPGELQLPLLLTCWVFSDAPHPPKRDSAWQKGRRTGREGRAQAPRSTAHPPSCPPSPAARRQPWKRHLRGWRGTAAATTAAEERRA